MQSEKKFEIISWKNTIAARCRWSDYAAPLVEDWDILWEDSYDDYQGSARVLAFKQGQLRYLEWSYGSCSGCDSYEDLSEEDVEKEFKNNVMMHFENSDIFVNWLKMLASTDDYKYKEFVSAISSVFKDNNTNWIEDANRLQSKITALILFQ